MGMELGDYIEAQGYHIIELPESLYNGGISVINLGMGRLLVSDPEIAKLLREDSKFKGSVQLLDQHFSYAFLGKSSLVFRSRAPEASLEMKPLAGKVERVWDVTKVETPAQTTDTVLMVAPIGFQTNLQTAVDNHFMHKSNETANEIERKALLEFSAFHRNLTDAGVKIVLFAAERFHKTPDAVFPKQLVFDSSQI